MRCKSATFLHPGLLKTIGTSSQLSTLEVGHDDVGSILEYSLQI